MPKLEARSQEPKLGNPEVLPRPHAASRHSIERTILRMEDSAATDKSISRELLPDSAVTAQGANC